MVDYVVVAMALLSIAIVLLATDDREPATWLPPAVLFSSALLARWLTTHHWNLAASVLSAGLLLLVVVTTSTYPSVYAGGIVAIALLVIGVILSRQYTIAISLLLTALIIVPVDLPLFHLPEELRPGLAIIAWVSTVVAWLICQPILVALRWSWRSYVDAEEKTSALRLQQGKLNQALKGLDDACYQLERANEDLALARKAAEEARRAKAEFATTISHELRTPLNLIVSLSELLVLDFEKNREARSWAELREDLETIYLNACQIVNLIDDVLDLSQVDAHRMALEKEPIALPEIVAQVVAMVDSLFRRKGLSLQISLPRDLPRVTADAYRVRQVLINLLNNAARFTNRGGATLSASFDDREVTISVRDTGVGIPARDLPHVFQEFRQVGDAIGHRYGGSGFGLYICKRLVELHGGTIVARSEEGEGTTFTFTLPLLLENVISTPAPLRWDQLTQATLEGPLTVAVVGKAPIVRVFQRYLDDYRVVPVADNGDGPHELKRHAPSALILAEPRASPDAWEAVHGRETSIPVIRCPFYQVQAGLTDEIAGYLSKPVTRDRLTAAIRRLGRGVRRIAVIDDDVTFARLVARMIRSTSSRYQVATFHDAAAALDAMRLDPPDAVLLDVLMPGLDGHAVLREMKSDATLRAIPTIVLSAFQSGDERVLAGDLTLGRRDGMSVGEAMRLVKAGLDLLLLQSTPTTEPIRALPRASAASPV
jgi:signal transduction histidine kinase/CheY-like chemotaxis protein